MTSLSMYKEQLRNIEKSSNFPVYGLNYGVTEYAVLQTKNGDASDMR